MEILIVAIAAALTSALTLFSGFGLGTILMPVFALFFSIDVAIAMTAIVHLLNNIFKLFFLGNYANKQVVVQFGIPAIVAAFLGAWVLLWFSSLEPLANYTIASNEFYITPVKLIIAILMMIFAILEMTPKILFDRKLLPIGGFLSGFFGGISGHQGALRSAFLLKYGLSKESFIANGVVIACVVDISRIFVYSSRFAIEFTEDNTLLLLIAIIAAFFGVFVGNKLIKKVTFRTVQLLVSVMLFGIALALSAGLI